MTWMVDPTTLVHPLWMSGSVSHTIHPVVVLRHSFKFRSAHLQHDHCRHGREKVSTRHGPPSPSNTHSWISTNTLLVSTSVRTKFVTCGQPVCHLELRTTLGAQEYPQVPHRLLYMEPWYSSPSNGLFGIGYTALEFRGAKAPLKLGFC